MIKVTCWVPSIKSWIDHPIDRLYRAGVSLSVGTDGRMLTPTTLIAEYEALERVFHGGAQEFSTTNLAALDAAFIHDAAKKPLRETLLQAYNKRPTV